MHQLQIMLCVLLLHVEYVILSDRGLLVLSIGPSCLSSRVAFWLEHHALYLSLYFNSATFELKWNDLYRRTVSSKCIVGIYGLQII